jgi:hypothetical protein
LVYTFQKVLWKLMEVKYGQKTILMAKEQHLDLHSQLLSKKML